MSNSASKANVKFVGVDDGHSGTKVFLGYDSATKEPIQKVIPSLVTKGGTDFTMINQNEVDENTVYVDGERYFTGSKFSRGGDDLVNNDYPTSGHNIALITQALRSFTGAWGNEVNNISIVTGLPLGHYFDKDTNKLNLDLINAKKDNVMRLETSYSPADGDKQLFKVVKNSVQPEGWGSVIDAIFTEYGEPTEQHEIIEEYGAIIVDIGGRTVDVMIIQPEVMSASYNDVFTYDLGVLFVHRVLADLLAEKGTINRGRPSRDKIEKLIATGYYDAGPNNRIDYRKEVAHILNTHINNIFDRLKSVIDAPEAVGGFIITGGGAELLGERLKKKIEAYNSHCNVTIPVDPVFSNARGFWKSAYLSDGN